ncbi:FAD:protein FMN transferase [Pseudothioclava arenosa]|uniref:FAD:protein FMN transferase n=1 Tax=Pseudothioclava arenosa TaxID=1795308 RepID=A0A2A4CNU2_9RHOB|nr:FAD:protein FMN transferase [Pseudothioclava arenosa]PCD76901.1 nosX [Pseudothioclava arenosa]
MKRRRFLNILAGAVAGAMLPAATRASEWRGRAFGAEARIAIRGHAAPAEVIASVRAEIARIEAVFSLQRDSELTRLNRDGVVSGSEMLRDALALAQRVNRATEGAFEPGVQPLWAENAAGAMLRESRMTCCVQDIQIGREIELSTGGALTFNGLAQGLATDRIAALLARAGLGEMLVDIGEQKALGGAFRLGLEDPAAGGLGQISLGPGRALATSSPGALIFPNGQSHILGPRGQRPLWSSVTVEAESAALADAAATGFILLERPAMRRAARALGLGRVWLVDFEGNLGRL